MNYQEELIKLYDECMLEIFKGEELSEDDKIDFELVRETIITRLSTEEISEKEKEFTLNNLDLYKRMIKAMLLSNEKELKLVAIEIMRKQRQ